MQNWGICFLDPPRGLGRARLFKRARWECTKTEVFFWGPYMRDPTILGPDSAPLFFGNPHTGDIGSYCFGPMLGAPDFWKLGSECSRQGSEPGGAASSLSEGWEESRPKVRPRSTSQTPGRIQKVDPNSGFHYSYGVDCRTLTRIYLFGSAQGSGIAACLFGSSSMQA